MYLKDFPLVVDEPQFPEEILQSFVASKEHQKLYRSPPNDIQGPVDGKKNQPACAHRHRHTHTYTKYRKSHVSLCSSVY